MAPSAAQQSAFEKCKAARAAALERKRAEKEAAAAAKQDSPPLPPAPEHEAEPEPEEEAPAPVAPPPPSPPPQAPVAALQVEEEMEFMDASELVDLIKLQGEALTTLTAEVKGLRQHTERISTRQEDLSQSFTQHGIKQAYSLSFV